MGSAVLAVLLAVLFVTFCYIPVSQLEKTRHVYIHN